MLVVRIPANSCIEPMHALDCEPVDRYLKFDDDEDYAVVESLFDPPQDGFARGISYYKTAEEAIAESLRLQEKSVAHEIVDRFGFLCQLVEVSSIRIQGGVEKPEGAGVVLVQNRHHQVGIAEPQIDNDAVSALAAHLPF